MRDPSPNYLASVRAQYEDYPYPKRDPEEEKNRLIDPFSDPLELVNYYCFEGRETFQNHFRVLVAGGGTGDAVIYLAEQLRHTNAEIVYVDISSASMAIAKQRANVRDLTNIRWVQGSLLDVASMGIGVFDYINCSGVLHHLADPTAGLRALASVLKDDGAMGVMVYGHYGRTGVYDMQALMRLLCQHVSDPQEKVNICKAVLAQLPATNWLALAPERLLQEINDCGDIGIYDLFLHSQDRAYTVPQFYQWAGECGLQLLDFITSDGDASMRYNPALYVSDAKLLEKMRPFARWRKQAIAEILTSNIAVHVAYLSPKPRPKPQADDPDNIPSLCFFADRSASMYENIYRLLCEQDAAAQGGYYHLSGGCHTVTITANSHSIRLFGAINGMRSIGEIIELVLSNNEASDPITATQLYAQFKQLYSEFHLYNWLILRHKSIEPFITTPLLQAPVTARYCS
jgi:SAM-dependent methyltransferase